ncbi:hypothetical protein PAAG_00483 [Paracoccidioides lutzii Pb01]|uniref:Uncharacterized protein n=1 Tax=Paracoccidioides lutzii (strain ATCC MYA-826 / Pb01) TaxID=502779 RepID=C1GPN8_PARBA|nr:hypothetical protein PAAG_00483 [Paracoccidioides lutzii Pb01]EEH36160.2 hypothetical protein PAAG_00483 [Paracoccidioides lutzii Pb01]
MTNKEIYFYLITFIFDPGPINGEFVFQIAQVKVFLSSPNTRDAPSLWTNGQMTEDRIKRSDDFRHDTTPDWDDTRKKNERS